MRSHAGAWERGLNHIELWKKIILAFIPIGAVGLLLHRQIKSLFSVEIVAVMFIVGGIILLIVEYFYQERTSTVREVDSISYKQALWIGIAQVAALIPEPAGQDLPLSAPCWWAWIGVPALSSPSFWPCR